MAGTVRGPGRRLRRWLVWPAAAICVLAAGLALLLATGPGGRLAGELVTRLANPPGAREVVVGEVVFEAPDRIRVSGVELADGGGVWLRLTRAQIGWRPAALLAGRLALATVEAERIEVLRRPAAGPATPEGEPGPLVPGWARGLRRLAVDRLDLAEPVLGEAATLRIEAAARPRREGVLGWTAKVRRAERPDDRYDLTAELAPATRRLDLALDVAEAQGGVIARALEIPGVPRLGVALAGAGTLDDWRGTLKAAIEDRQALAADVILGTRPGGAVGWRIAGTASPPPSLTQGLPAALRGEASLALEGAWDPARERVAIEHARLAGKALAVEAEGTIDLAKSRIEGTARLEATDGTWIKDATGGRLAVASARIEVTATGPLARPALVLQAHAAGLAAGPVAAATATAKLSLGQPAAGGLPVRAEAELAGLRHRDALSRALVGTRASLAASAVLAPADLTLSGLAGTLGGEGLTLEVADGTLRLGEGTGSLRAVARLPDLARLRPAIGAAARGRLDVEARVRLAPDATSLDLAGRFATLETGIPLASALLGAAPELRGALALRPDGAMTLRDVVVSAPGMSATATVAVDRDGRLAEARYRAEVPRLAALSGALGVGIAGALALDGTASGALADPAARLRISVPALAVDGRPLGRLAAEVAAERLASALAGTLDLTLAPPEGPLRAKARFALKPTGTLALTGIAVEGLGAEATGAIDLPPGAGPPEGMLALRIADLGRLSRIAGTTLAGTATATVELGARPRVEAEASGLRVADTVTAQRAKCTLRLSGLAPKGNGECTAEKAALAGAPVAKLTARLDGGLDGARVAVSLSGLGGAVGRLEADGSFARAKQGLSARLDRLEATLAGKPVRLEGPVDLALGEDRIDLGQAAFAVGEGALRLQARVGKRDVDARLAAERLPLEMLSALDPTLALAGRLSATARLSGASRRPDGELSLAVDGLALAGRPDGVVENVPPLAARAKATLRGGVLKAEARVEGIAGADLAADGTMSVAVSALPPSAALVEDAPLKAKASWRGDLRMLTDWFPIPSHLFAGNAEIAADIAGTPRAPRATGTLRLRDGRYENLITGTILKRIELDADVDGERVTVALNKADDGLGGRVSGRGFVDLAPGRGFPVGVDLEADKAALMRRDDIVAVASGKVRLDGTLGALKLSGTLKADQVDWRIGGGLPPDVAQLDVVEVNGTAGAPAAPAANGTEASGSSLTLDVALEAPRRIYVRGHGLESEWRGDLKVTGPVETPSIRGRLEVARGQFDLAGKPFVLSKGTAEFEGGSDPALDIAAVNTASDLTATITITGRASQPKIALSSVPDLPRDEILSRVLFGKSSASLTKFQAAQLGIAIASMAGDSGGAIGILSRTRRALGLDVLGAGTSESGKPTVAAGKYLGGAYVGVEQGAGAESGKVKVEVDLLPNVSVTTGVGADAQGTVGIQWKWDY